MIASQDRSGWFGASDVSKIMGNWNTESFKKWWLEKLGITSGGYKSVAMNAGTYYEHPILDAVGYPRKDHQILIPEYRLRINLDGDDIGRLGEVKTHSAEKEFKVSLNYRRQVNVQMYGKLREEGRLPVAEVISYGLREEDYKSFFNPIDKARIKHHPVVYDGGFVNAFLVRVKYLKKCLEKGVFPDENYTMRKGC